MKLSYTVSGTKNNEYTIKINSVELIHLCEILDTYDSEAHVEVTADEIIDLCADCAEPPSRDMLIGAMQDVVGRQQFVDLLTRNLASIKH